MQHLLVNFYLARLPRPNPPLTLTVTVTVWGARGRRLIAVLPKQKKGRPKGQLRSIGQLVLHELF